MSSGYIQHHDFNGLPYQNERADSCMGLLDGKPVYTGIRVATERNARLKPPTHSSAVPLPFRSERVGQHPLLHANEADVHQNWEGGGRQQSRRRPEQESHACQH